jgi:hypothetical protein
MQLVARLFVVLALLVPSVAFADKEGDRKEVTAADAEKFLGFFNKFVDAVVASKDNCPKMATSLNAVVDANLDTVKRANDAKAANQKLPKAIEEKMMARVKEMMPAMQKCGSDKEVQKAIARLEPKKDAAK